MNLLCVHLSRLIKENNLNMMDVIGPGHGGSGIVSHRGLIVACVVSAGEEAICSGLSWIGVRLDDSRNRSARNPVSDGPSRGQVLVLASQEDEQIARHAWGLPR